MNDDFDSAAVAAATAAGDIVLLMKAHPQRIPEGAAHRRLQLISKNSAAAEWKTTMWQALFFSGDPIEVAVEAVALKMEQQPVVSVVADLEEAKVDAPFFLRFVKATSLDCMGLPTELFAPTATRTWGWAPGRHARKTAAVKRENLLKVLAISGKAQISLKMEYLEEEKALSLATHTVEDEDSEHVLKRLEGVQHVGVIHLKGGRTLIRCMKEHLAAVRSKVSPDDPKYSLAPDLCVRRRFAVMDVPNSVSPFALSSAVAKSMGWRQLPLGAFKNNQRRGTHEIHLGAEEAPSSDTALIHSRVCLIREINPASAVVEAQPRVLPPSAPSHTMEVENHSVCQVVERKVALEVQAAQKILTEQAEERDKNTGLAGRITQLEQRMAAMAGLSSEVGHLKQQCSDTLSVVKEVQHQQSQLEPLIEQKVMQATEAASHALGVTLEAKFDKLGHQLMSQLASLAKKREHDGDEAMEGKSLKGLGGAKRGRKVRKVLRRPGAKIRHPCREQQETAAEEPEVAATQLDPPSQQDVNPAEQVAAIDDETDKRVLIKLQSHPRGRKPWSVWMDSEALVRDLQWEYGRVSRRGVSKFRILDPQGKELRMMAPLAELDQALTYWVVAESPSPSQLAWLEGREAEPDAELQQSEWMQRLLILEQRVDDIETTLAASRQAEPALRNADLAVAMASSGGASARERAVPRKASVPTPLGLGGSNWQQDLGRLLQSLATSDVASSVSEPSRRSREPSDESSRINDGRLPGQSQGTSVSSDGKGYIREGTHMTSDSSLPGKENGPPPGKAYPGMGMEYKSKVDLEDKVASYDDEPPRSMKKWQLDMETFYASAKIDCHAFSVMHNHLSLATPDGPLRRYVDNTSITASKSGWHMMCLKCGLTTELRRWKQNRHFNCRKHIEIARGKRARVESQDSSEWHVITGAFDQLNAMSRSETITLNPQKRKDLIALVDVSTAILRAENVREGEQRRQVGAGGRRFTVATANVGGLTGKVAGLRHVANSLCVQETIVPKQRERNLRGEAAGNGFAYFSGSPSAMKTDLLGRLGPTKGQGLAILCGSGMQWFGLDSFFGSSKQPGRRIHSGWLVAGSLAIVLHNVYCQTAFRDSWGQANSDLILEVRRRIREAPTTMQIVAGDFQCEPHGIEELGSLYHQGWVATSMWPGITQTPTNRPSHGESRHIDGMILSPACLPFLEKVAVTPLNEMSTHDAVVITLNDARADEMATFLEPPLLDDELEPRNSSGFVWSVGEGTYDEWLDQVDLCLLPNSARKWGRIGKIHLTRKSIGGVRKPNKMSPSRWAICVAKKALERIFEARNLMSGGSLTLRQEARLMQLHELLGRVHWEAVGVEEWFSWSSDGLKQAAERMTRVIEWNQLQMSRNLKRWKARMQQSVLRQAQEHSRWIREESVALRGVQCEDSVCADPVKMVEVISDAWKPLFGEVRDWNSDQARATFPEIGTPFVVPPVSASELMSAAKKKGAAGAEGITKGVLARLPMEGWHHLALVFRDIERGGEWPSELLWVRMAPLAKPDSPEVPAPTKIRLISVESNVVRAWSSLRFRQLIPWLQGVLSAEVLGGITGRQALVCAGARDLQRTMCDLDSLPYGEVSFDWARCFDSLPKGLLVDLAVHLGMPLEIGDALRRYLYQSERVVVMRGWVGSDVSGPRGVPQGNALSVMMALVWTEMWCSQLKSMISPMGNLAAFYDDMSVGSQQDRDIRVAIGYTSEFGRVWGVCLNEDKSTLTMNDAARVQWQMDHIALPRKGAWNFVGVSLGPSKNSDRVAKRLVRMESRLDRLKTFPGSRLDMCQVVATHVNSLAYGLCFESRHVDSLKKMCTRLWDLCWGTARYTANRGWTWASTIHRLTNPVTCLWLEAARILWLVGNHAEYADLTKAIWTRLVGGR